MATTQRELRRHLVQVLARTEYTEEQFKRALEEYLSEHPHLDRQSEKCVKWTTPGVWTRFVRNCWVEYRQYREVFR